MASNPDSRPHHNGAPRRRRSLEIPPPPGEREIVVVEALKTLTTKRKKFIRKVEDAIEDNGITIEVARLRDRLTKLALGDTERLLLSTPGVTEKLFYKAIEEELEDYDTDRFKDFLAEMFRERGGKGTGGGETTSSASTGRSTPARSSGGTAKATSTRAAGSKQGTTKGAS
jgi:hypothetical protein